MSSGNHIRQKSKQAKVKVKPYPGKLPQEVIFPEKLAKANDLLKSIKDLNITLQNLKK
ncbi:MAG: hypothetical protein JWQ09_4910 [Segetibacter sp.]|nr:hypothetical protein [Segetibacter sp.]